MLQPATIHIGQRDERQPLAQGRFILWMHILGIADVDGDGQSGVRQRQNLRLALAHQGIVAHILQRRQLHRIKLEISLAP